MTMTPLTLLDAIAGYARTQTGSGSADRPIRLATVDPAFDLEDGFLPKVTFDGETALSGKRYPYGAGYIPVAGDRVVLLPVGSTYWIVGSVSNHGRQGFQADATNDLYVTWFGPDSYVSVDAGVTTLVLDGNSVHPNAEGVNAQSLASGSENATTSYTTLGGNSPSFDFTKRETATRLRIDMAEGYYVTAADTGVRFGVRINGTDYDVTQRNGTQTANVHETAVGTRIISGIPAGTYTIDGRWKKTAGTGNTVRDFNDWHSIACTEVD